MPETTPREILELADHKLLDHPRTIEEWAQVLDCSVDRAQQAIEVLRRKGLIKETQE